MTSKKSDESDEFESEEDDSEVLEEDAAFELVEARIEELGLITPQDSEFSVD